MPGGNGCLTARGLRNVAIASAPSVIVIVSRFLPIDGLWRAATAAWHATRGARRRAPALGSVAGVVLVLSGVASGTPRPWLVALRLALVPVTYGLDRALRGCACRSVELGPCPCGSIGLRST